MKIFNFCSLWKIWVKKTIFRDNVLKLLLRFISKLKKKSQERQTNLFFSLDTGKQELVVF